MKAGVEFRTSDRPHSAHCMFAMGPASSASALPSRPRTLLMSDDGVQRLTAAANHVKEIVNDHLR
jgi:hypothetical protein